MGRSLGKRQRKYVQARKKGNARRERFGRKHVDPSKNSFTAARYKRKRNLEDSDSEPDEEKPVKKKARRPEPNPDGEQPDGGFAPKDWKVPADLQAVNSFLDGLDSSDSEPSVAELSELDEAEAPKKPPKKKKKAPKPAKSAGGMAQHQADLVELQKADPAFFKYLQRESPELLLKGVPAGPKPAADDDEAAFLEDQDDDSEDSESGEEGTKAKGRPKKKAGAQTEVLSDDSDAEAEEAAALAAFEGQDAAPGDSEDSDAPAHASTDDSEGSDVERLARAPNEPEAKPKEPHVALSKDGLAEICGDLEGDEPKWPAFLKLIQHFKRNCRSLDPNNKSETLPLVTDAQVYADLMRFCFASAGSLFDTFLGGTEKNEVNYHQLANNKKWRKAKKPLTVFFESALLFLRTVPDPKMKRFAIFHLAKMTDLFRHLSRQRDKFRKILIKLWAVSENMEVSVDAFTAIYEMGRLLNQTVLKTILKQTYRTYGRQCARVNTHTASRIKFMRDCLAKLFGIDQQLSYQIGFVCLRELITLLRAAIQNAAKPTALTKSKGHQQSSKKKKQRKTGKDAHRQVYNWAFVNCLYLWTKVIGDHAAHKSSPLYSLIYPHVHLLLGTLTLKDGPVHFPIKFHLAAMVCELVEKTGVHIPLVPHLTAILDSGALKKKGKKADIHSIELQHQLKFSNEQLPTRLMQDAIVETATSLIERYCKAYAYNIAFPELVIPVTYWLRRINKSEEIFFGYRKRIVQLARRLEANAEWVRKKREKVDFSPADVVKCDAFLSDEKADKKSPLEKAAPSLVNRDLSGGERTRKTKKGGASWKKKKKRNKGKAASS